MNCRVEEVASLGSEEEASAAAAAASSPLADDEAEESANPLRRCRKVSEKDKRTERSWLLSNRSNRIATPDGCT